MKDVDPHTLAISLWNSTSMLTTFAPAAALGQNAPASIAARPKMANPTPVALVGENFMGGGRRGAAEDEATTPVG